MIYSLKRLRIGPSASQVQPESTAALLQKIQDLERQLHLKNAVNRPPMHQKAALKEMQVKNPDEENAMDGEAMTPEEIRAAKAAVATGDDQVEEFGEGEEEEPPAQESEVEVEPSPPCSTVAVPLAPSKIAKINSSTHKCEYNRLMRHMQSSATEFPNMAQLWNGNNKDHFSSSMWLDLWIPSFLFESL